MGRVEGKLGKERVDEREKSNINLATQTASFPSAWQKKKKSVSKFHSFTMCKKKEGVEKRQGQKDRGEKRVAEGRREPRFYYRQL